MANDADDETNYEYDDSDDDDDDDDDDSDNDSQDSVPTASGPTKYDDLLLLARTVPNNTMIHICCHCEWSHKI